MGRVSHFEISTTNPGQAAEFYRSVFGWDIKKWAGPVDYWLITTGPDDQVGINGGFWNPGSPTFAGTTNTITVDNLDEAVEKVKAAGGEVITEKHTIPGVGYQIYCKDVDGNPFGLHQTDPQAGQSA